MTARWTIPFRAIAFVCSLFAAGAGTLVRADQTPAVRVEGVVADASGDRVAGAAVTLETPDQRLTATSDRDGKFVFEAVTAAAGRLTVRAEGFAELAGTWTTGDGVLALTLEPLPLDESTTVTASRVETRLNETPASLVVFSRRDLDATASPVLDGALRQAPGFRLFRRTDSRVANPTSQGAALRGIGPSGASRVVVLDDGVPLNDPFGGWTVWSRVPREAVRRVDVLRGGGSSLYGTDALGGVVNILGDSRLATSMSVDASVGSLDTRSVSFAGSLAREGWLVRAAVDAFHTDGYVLVDEDSRGAADTRAGSGHASVAATLERGFSNRGRIFARGTYFDESRENGTPLQTNQTMLRHLAVGVDWRFDGFGSIVSRAWASSQEYDQTFSALAPDRDSESLTRAQRVPAQQTGGWLVWSRPVGGWLVLVAGVEGREVRGTSDELGFFDGRAASRLESGGRQRSVGVFGEGLVRLGPDVVLTLGGRADRWRNFAASTRTESLADPDTAAVRTFQDRVETAFDPRLQVQWSLAPAFSIRAAAYRAFRAPTLNELYRGFRAGNIVTAPNADLRSERLTGGEAGARWTAFDDRIDVRGTFFWSVLERPVANVTLSVTPDLITRRRENAGRIRARGVEVDVDARLGGRVRLGGGYVFQDSTVTRFDANVAIVGLRVPQVPRHEATAQVRVDGPWKCGISAQGRFSGAQFEDDQNRLRLGRALIVDARAGRPFGSVEVYAAIENLFGRRVDVGRTPVLTVGPPFTVLVGVRWRPE